MKCPECGLKTRVLETREDPVFKSIWRQRECPQMHRFETIESAQKKYTPSPERKRR